MAIIVKPRRTYTTGKTPDDFTEGELLINFTDKNIITKDKDDNIFEFPTVGKINSMIQNKSLFTSNDLINYFNSDNVSVDPDTGLINIQCTNCDDSTTVDDLKLSSNWSSDLQNLENDTYNIKYDGDDYHIVDGGRDVYDNGNYIKVNDNNLSYSTSIYKSKGFLLFNLTDVMSVKFSGSTGADFAGTVLSDENITIDSSKKIYTSYKVIEGGFGGDPAIHHIVFSNKTVDTHEKSSDPDNDKDDYYFSGVCDIFLLVMWSKSSNAWDDGNLPLSSIYNALFN